MTLVLSKDVERAVLEGKSQRERLHEKTFRGWVNKALSKSDMSIDNLVSGLFDGVMLVRLVENLTMEKVTQKVKMNPTMDLHRIENVNVALANLRNFVPDVDVDAAAIVARNTKLILGFVWQLILRFQILAGENWEGGNAGNVMKKAREKVLAWWREQLAEYAKVVKISDGVEDSFNDGMAIIALIHKLDPSNVDIREAARRRRDEGHDGRRANVELAFQLAEKHLKIMPLLDARDMCAEDSMARPDEQCILTYVSEFPPAFAAVYDGAAAIAKRRAEIDKMKAEMEMRRAEQQRHLDDLRRQQANKAQQSEAEKKRIAADGERRAAELRAEFERRKRDELSEIESASKRAQQIIDEQMELLRSENAAKILSLKQAAMDAAAMSREEQQRLEKERDAELARLEAEKEMLQKMKDEELRELKLSMLQQQRDREEALKRELEEREAQLRMTKEEYETWKEARDRDIDKMRREREALAAAIQREIARLRKENDQLRRGEPHSLTKRSFGAPTWCHMCRSYLFSNKAEQCERTACNYVICTKCTNSHGAPNNCLGDVARGHDALADESKVESLAAMPTLADGWLQKKGYNTGRWNKRWFVLKRGCLLYFANDKAAVDGIEHRKGAFVLNDCHIVKYAKEKRDMFTFGVESKNACMWLGAVDEADEERWVAALDQAIVHSTETSDAAMKSINALFADAAQHEQQATKLVRLKGGTMLVSREAGQAIVESLRGHDHDEDTAPKTTTKATSVPSMAKPANNGASLNKANTSTSIPSNASLSSTTVEPPTTRGGRTRAVARNADFDPSILPTSKEVYDAIQAQEQKQRDGAKSTTTTSTPSTSTPTTTTIASSTSTTATATPQRALSPGPAAAAPKASPATAEGEFKCNICGKAYAIQNDLKYHMQLRHADGSSSAAPISTNVEPVDAATLRGNSSAAQFDVRAATEAIAKGGGVVAAKNGAKAVAMGAKRMIAADGGSLADRAAPAKDLVGAQRELRLAIEAAAAESPAHAEKLQEAGKLVQAAVVKLVTEMKEMVKANTPDAEALPKLQKGGSEVATAIVKLVAVLSIM